MSNYVYETPTIDITFNLIYPLYYTHPDPYYSKTIKVPLTNGTFFCSEEFFSENILDKMTADHHNCFSKYNITIIPNNPIDTYINTNTTFTLKANELPLATEDYKGSIIYDFRNLTTDEKSIMYMIGGAYAANAAGTSLQYTYSTIDNYCSGDRWDDCGDYSCFIGGAVNSTYPVIYFKKDQSTSPRPTNQAFNKIDVGIIQPNTDIVTVKATLTSGQWGRYYLAGHGYTGSGIQIGNKDDIIVVRPSGLVKV